MDKQIEKIEYICIPCQESFKDEKYLQNHYLKYHVVKKHIYKENIRRYGTPKESNCISCGKKIIQIWNITKLYCSTSCRAKAYRNRLILFQKQETQ